MKDHCCVNTSPLLLQRPLLAVLLSLHLMYPPPTEAQQLQWMDSVFSILVTLMGQLSIIVVSRFVVFLAWLFVQ